MPSESSAATPTEKPHHYSYLKEFRTQQCPLFLQHKCTQHRPYTCFHWHFMNQRRRRPVRKRDGTYNYSPDVYCTKYDETTGICADGDECPLLHRTAGDTERRYHLRYYKTCTCVYETDIRGHCMKNGAHCAFAHGVQDLRPPLYDVRELHALETAEKQGSLMSESPLGSSLEKDRIINEDPRWNDTNYVLANYKTEPCKRPPRLCRQGYACPSYHNTRDRRRSPKKYKYRSTPCPNVKHGDDWGDPTQCENGDGCAYCHTRTEQQFHPEIYKSTKCNDMVQTGYCPRGPFCAFAHVEHEMTTQRDVSSPSETSLAAFVTNVLPSSKAQVQTTGSNNNGAADDKGTAKNGSLSTTSTSTNGNDIPTNDLNVSGNIPDSISISYPEPIGKGRTSSLSSSVTSESSVSYQRAPGSEREDTHVKLRLQMQSIENDPSLDQTEKSKRKQNLLLLHNLNIGSPNTLAYLSSSQPIATSPSAVMSPQARAFYPENALEEDLNLGELNLNLLERDLIKDNDNDTNSVCSSLSTGFPANTSYLGATSVPVTIPSGGGYQRNSVGSLSQSPCSSPVGSLQLGFLTQTQQTQQQQQQQQKIHDAAAAFLSQPNPGKFSAPGFSEFSSVSPRNNGSGISQSPMLSASYGATNFNDVQRMREELVSNKAKLMQWEEGISQARNACEAWKREAEESKKKARQADDERQQAIRQRDEALNQMTKLRQELDQIRAATILGAAVSGSSFLGMQRPCEPDPNHMKQVQKRLRMDLEKMEMLKKQQQTTVGMKCGLCQMQGQTIQTLPCSHYGLCEACTSKCTQCPMCHCPVTAQANFVLPM